MLGSFNNAFVWVTPRIQDGSAWTLDAEHISYQIDADDVVILRIARRHRKTVKVEPSADGVHSPQDTDTRQSHTAFVVKAPSSPQNNDELRESAGHETRMRGTIDSDAHCHTASALRPRPSPYSIQDVAPHAERSNATPPLDGDLTRVVKAIAIPAQTVIPRQEVTPSRTVVKTRPSKKKSIPVSRVAPARRVVKIGSDNTTSTPIPQVMPHRKVIPPRTVVKIHPSNDDSVPVSRVVPTQKVVKIGSNKAISSPFSQAMPSRKVISPRTVVKTRTGKKISVPVPRVVPTQKVVKPGTDKPTSIPLPQVMPPRRVMLPRAAKTLANALYARDAAGDATKNSRASGTSTPRPKSRSKTDDTPRARTHSLPRRLAQQKHVASTRPTPSLCAVPHCTAFATGDAQNADRIWPAGRRCAEHGGGYCCNVKGCSKEGVLLTKCHDNSGPAGRRCRHHRPRSLQGPKNSDDASKGCVVKDCFRVADCYARVEDKYGPPGSRCSKHGNGLRCNVLGCLKHRFGTMCTEDDEWGVAGPRCFRHGGRNQLDRQKYNGSKGA